MGMRLQSIYVAVWQIQLGGRRWSIQVPANDPKRTLIQSSVVSTSLIAGKPLQDYHQAVPVGELAGEGPLWP